MSNILPFLIMSPVEAARWRDLTKNDVYKVDPILIRAGGYQGKYAVAARLKADPDYQTHWDAFAMCDEVALDVASAFPPSPEDLAARKASEE